MIYLHILVYMHGLIVLFVDLQPVISPSMQMEVDFVTSQSSVASLVQNASMDSQMAAVNENGPTAFNSQPSTSQPPSNALEFLGPEMADLQQLLSSIISGNTAIIIHHIR